MPTSRPRFLSPTRTALFLLLSLCACSGVTGPARRHLAAVEAAETALTLPRKERQRALEAARDELRAILDTSPGLAGAKLTLATVYARLGEAKLALSLAPPPDDQRPEERPGWSALDTWAKARAGRWDELLNKAPGPELMSLAQRYRDYAVAATPCGPATATPEATPTAAAVAPEACCTDATGPCLECLAAVREAWCRRDAVGSSTDSLLAVTEHAATSPHLELARARLRASILASAGRHDDARLALEAARAVAQKLVADPSAETPLAALSIDLDRAILLAWSGDLEKSRALLTTLQLASPPEPLRARVQGLADALAPPPSL